MLLFARIVIALVLSIRERASTHLLNETQDMKDSFVDGMKNSQGSAALLRLWFIPPQNTEVIRPVSITPSSLPFVPSLPIHIPPLPRPWVWLQL